MESATVAVTPLISVPLLVLLFSVLEKENVKKAIDADGDFENYV